MSLLSSAHIASRQAHYIYSNRLFWNDSVSSCHSSPPHAAHLDDLETNPTDDLNTTQVSDYQSFVINIASSKDTAPSFEKLRHCRHTLSIHVDASLLRGQDCFESSA